MRREFVAGREEDLRAKTLEQRAPGFVASQSGSQRRNALRRDDGHQPRLTRERERTFVTGRVGFAHGRKGVVLVCHEQDVAPDAFGIGRNLRNALEYGALEIQLEHHAETAGQCRIRSDGKIEAEYVSGFAEIFERRKGTRLTWFRRANVSVARLR